MDTPGIELVHRIVSWALLSFFAIACMPLWPPVSSMGIIHGSTSACFRNPQQFILAAFQTENNRIQSELICFLSKPISPLVVPFSLFIAPSVIQDHACVPAFLPLLIISKHSSASNVQNLNTFSTSTAALVQATVLSHLSDWNNLIIGLLATSLPPMLVRIRYWHIWQNTQHNRTLTGQEPIFLTLEIVQIEVVQG